MEVVLAVLDQVASITLYPVTERGGGRGGGGEQEGGVVESRRVGGRWWGQEWVKRGVWWREGGGDVESRKGCGGEECNGALSSHLTTLVNTEI